MHSFGATNDDTNWIQLATSRDITNTNSGTIHAFLFCNKVVINVDVILVTDNSSSNPLTTQFCGLLWPHWQPRTIRNLQSLPICGRIFKKTVVWRNVSCLLNFVTFISQHQSACLTACTHIPLIRLGHVYSTYSYDIKCKGFLFMHLYFNVSRSSIPGGPAPIHSFCFLWYSIKIVPLPIPTTELIGCSWLRPGILFNWTQ